MHRLIQKPVFNSKQTFLVMALMVAVGIVAVRIFAAGPAASFEVANGKLADGATVAQNAGAIGGRMVLFGGEHASSPPPITPAPTPTATPTPPPAASSDWPNATNTGYTAAPDYPGSLKTCSSSIQSNTTYRFCNFPNGLYIGSGSSHPVNVTFYGCRFGSNAVNDANVAMYGDNITFDYSTFEPNTVTKPPVAHSKGYQYAIDVRYAGKMTVNHSNLWGWANGIQFGSSSQAKPLVISNSWFHDARDDGGLDHTDAILENYGGPSYMVFDHNTIVSAGNTNGLALQGNSYSHVTVTNNYFSGFGYTVNIGGSGRGTSYVTFTDNTFGTDIKPVWGPLYGWSDNSGNLWRRNKWRVAPGGYDTDFSRNGKYWLPNGTVSATDYAH